MTRRLQARWTQAALAAAAVLLLALPAAASAATRYAAPGGGGPSGDCPQADPCSLSDAVGFAAASDVVLLLGGTYNIGGGNIGIFAPITIQPAPGTSPVTVANTGGTTFVVTNTAPGTVIRDLRIAVHNSGGDAIHTNQGGTSTFERLHVTATGTTVTGVTIEGVLRDSVVDFKGSTFGTGVATCCDSGTTLIQNVTVSAPPANANGIAVYDTFGDPQNVTIRNSIARASQNGIFVGGNDVGGNTVATVSNSNYSSAIDDGATDSILNLGGGNQTAAPLFANPTGGDFRQLPGSPTLDAGTGTGISSVDFEGQPRLQGPAVDIGADEAPDPSSLLAFGEVGKLKRKRTLKIPAACPIVNCNIAAAANLVVKGAAKSAAASRVIKLKNVSASLTAGQEQTLRFKLSKKAFKRLRAAKKARLTVSAAITAPLGFTGTESASFKFKKAGKK